MALPKITAENANTIAKVGGGILTVLQLVQGVALPEPWHSILLAASALLTGLGFKAAGTVSKNELEKLRQPSTLPRIDKV